MADPGGARPPTAQKFLDFMQFLGNFDKIVCWRPPEGRRPLLLGILDPPWEYIVDNSAIIANFVCLWKTMFVSPVLIGQQNFSVIMSRMLVRPEVLPQFEHK